MRTAALVTFMAVVFMTGQASGFNINGKYSYNEPGCSGSMEIKEVTGMDPHIIATISTACTEEAHTCELTVRGVRVISTNDTVSATFAAPKEYEEVEPAKFDIDVTKYGAIVKVEQRGPVCGMNGSYDGKWTKDGVKQPVVKNKSKEATKLCSAYVRVKKDCYNKARKGMMPDRALATLKKTTLPEQLRDDACRDGFAAFGRAGSVKEAVLLRAMQDDFTECYNSVMK